VISASAFLFAPDARALHLVDGAGNALRAYHRRELRHFHQCWYSAAGIVCETAGQLATSRLVAGDTAGGLDDA
jgi:hypothetical protein